MEFDTIGMVFLVNQPNNLGLIIKKVRVVVRYALQSKWVITKPY